jgi:hypothetical protein
MTSSNWSSDYCITWHPLGFTLLAFILGEANLWLLQHGQVPQGGSAMFMSTATFAQLTVSFLQSGRSLQYSPFTTLVHCGVLHRVILQLSTTSLQEILIFKDYIYTFVPPRDCQRANAEQNRLRACPGVWGEEFAPVAACCILSLISNRSRSVYVSWMGVVESE